MAAVVEAGSGMRKLKEGEVLRAEPSTTRRTWIALAALVVAAVVVRLAAIVILQAWEEPNAMEHASIAWHLANGEGFTFIDWNVKQITSVQSPPYPVLLWGLYEVFGTDQPNLVYGTAMVLNAFLGGLAVAVTYLMARRIGAARRWG